LICIKFREEKEEKEEKEKKENKPNKCMIQKPRLHKVEQCLDVSYISMFELHEVQVVHKIYSLFSLQPEYFQKKEKKKNYQIKKRERMKKK